MRTKKTIFLSLFAVLSFTGAAAGVGCSGTDSSDSGSSNTNGAGGKSSGSTSSGSGQGGDLFDIDSGTQTDGALNADSACASQSSEAALEKKPVDIIIAIDNSGSMGEEIVGVQNNINQNFAQIIENSGVDYRVILVAKHGKANPDESICVEAPLSGIPAGGCATPPAKPVLGPRFFQYDTEVASHNSLCILMSTFSTPDLNGFAPNGWKDWLRPDSFKAFIELTDDGISCSFGGVTYNDADTVNGGNTTADKFDTALLALSPQHFGTAAARNYKWYSIVAMAFNNPADKPYEPSDPVTAGTCPTAAGPGTGYQALSVKTEGLRFPLCDTTSYDAVFKAIAAGVVSGAKVSCDFPIPPPPMGETIDLKTVVVEYTPGDGSPAQQYKQVADSTLCTPDSFYIDAASNTIFLCQDTCTSVQKDAAAKIAVLFGCDQGGAN